MDYTSSLTKQNWRDITTTAIQAHAASIQGIPSEEECMREPFRKPGVTLSVQGVACAVRNLMLSAFSAQTERDRARIVELEGRVDSFREFYQEECRRHESVGKERDELKAKIEALETPAVEAEKPWKPKFKVGDVVRYMTQVCPVDGFGRDGYYHLQGDPPQTFTSEDALEFADPYAHLRTAHAAGKVIQHKRKGGVEWFDADGPLWLFDHEYRIKPTKSPAPSRHPLVSDEMVRDFLSWSETQTPTGDDEVDIAAALSHFLAFLETSDAFEWIYCSRDQAHEALIGNDMWDSVIHADVSYPCFRRRVLRSDLQRLLGNLLAILHRDGGHYQSEHGTGKAVADAVTKWHELQHRLEEVEKLNDWAKGIGRADQVQIDGLIRARAEVQRQLDAANARCSEWAEMAGKHGEDLDLMLKAAEAQKQRAERVEKELETWKLAAHQGKERTEKAEESHRCCPGCGKSYRMAEYESLRQQLATKEQELAATAKELEELAQAGRWVPVSDTPRSQANRQSPRATPLGDIQFDLDPSGEWVSFEDSQSLERELQQSNAKLEKWRAFGVQAAYVFGVATIGSCTCMTKSPDIQYHKETCCYRRIIEATETLKKLQSP